MRETLKARTKSHLEKIFQQALANHRAGNLAEAERLYRRLLEDAPREPEVLHLLGIAVHQARRDPAALELLRRAVQLKPNFPEALSSLANLLRELGRGPEAIDACRRAIALRPGFAEAHNNLGSILKAEGRLEEAAAAYSQALAADASYRPALVNLGITLHQLQRYEEAAEVHRRLIALDPRSAEGHSNLAVTLHAAGDFEAAVAANNLALTLQPGLARTLQNRALSLEELGRQEESLRDLEAALAITPEDAEAHWNRSLGLLRSGRLLEGWQEYEWRWQVPAVSRPLRPWHRRWPRWDGRPLQGSRILLHAEQGLGDTIQFARYAPLVTLCGGEVAIEVAPHLQRLMKSLSGVEVLSWSDHPADRFDCQAPLLSLPGILETRLETIPSRVPYLQPDAGDMTQWRKRLEDRVGAPRVGLVWAGSPTHKRDSHRSLPLEFLLPLLQTPGIHWFSLQKGERARDLQSLPPGLVADVAQELGDFADTAALISNLDLTLTVDTAVAHLAGALGRPAWVLLPYVADWRWLTARDDSPWYPTLRLFRQPARGDWKSVIERVRALLTSAALQGGSQTSGLRGQ